MTVANQAAATKAPIWRYFRSVATRLALTTASIMLVVSILIYYVLTDHERFERLRLNKETAMSVVTLFAELISAQVERADEPGIKDSLGYLRSNNEVLAAAVFPLSPSGEIGPALGLIVQPKVILPPLRAPPLGAVGKVLQLPHALEVSQWVEDGSGKRIGVAALRFSLARENEGFAALRKSVFLIAISVAGLLTLLLFFLARTYIIAPLRAVHAAVSDLTTSSARPAQAGRRQLPLQAHGEIGDLARGFTRMSAAIAKREAAIAEQNEQMRLVLGNLGQGFLVVDASGVIGGQHSTVLETWFGPVQTGQTLWQYLGPHDRELNEWLALTWSNIGSMPLALCLEQLPKTFSCRERNYQIHYHAVRSRDQVDMLDKMVVVIDDVTELRVREDAEREQRGLVGAIMALIRDRTGFASLCEETEALINELASGRSTREQLERLHTLKGNAYLFKLLQLAEACEQVEAQCARDARLPTRSDAAELSHAYAQNVGPLSGLIERRSEQAVQLSSRDYAALLAALEAGASNREVLAQLTRATAEPAEVVFAKFSERLQILARRLGKCPVIVTCDDGGLSFPRQSYAPLWAATVHVLRNIADHGLETAWEREQKGKPACAEVIIRARAADSGIQISFQDDGRGVDWERVREQATQRGLPHTTRAQLTRALFAHGLSTADEDMTLSGRGVGLSALASEAHALGGSISLESELGRGTKLTIDLPALHQALVG